MLRQGVTNPAAPPAKVFGAGGALEGDGQLSKPHFFMKVRGAARPSATAAAARERGRHCRCTSAPEGQRGSIFAVRRLY